jgi:LysM repeat protein
LIRIAHHFGVGLKALEAENNLTTTHIKVGQKLNIPAKPDVQPAPVNTPPATAPSPQPAPDVPAPSTPAPAAANPPAGQ